MDDCGVRFGVDEPELVLLPSVSSLPSLSDVLESPLREIESLLLYIPSRDESS